MKPLFFCHECRAVFAQTVQQDEFDFEYDLVACPSCGWVAVDNDEWEIVPDHFELARFWEIITYSFPIRERIALKAISDRGMKLP